METPAGNSEGSWPGDRRSPGLGRPGGFLGSLTVPGHPEEVASARAFVTRTLSGHRIGTDTDAAALLTSEVVTNAIQHTKSGVDGGTVTIVVTGVPHGVLVEVIDEGSPGTPVVKGDLYAAEGHGLFLVQQLAARWGYLRDTDGTTVWFVLPAAGRPSGATEQVDRRPDGQEPRPQGAEQHGTWPSYLWAAAIHSATEDRDRRPRLAPRRAGPLTGTPPLTADRHAPLTADRNGPLTGTAR
jgi:anti-sigma regulatory factor (Ser/Thr protein kinase)